MEHSKSYGKFVLMIVLSFLTMYGSMYAMVYSLSDVYNNVNQLYMAGLMALFMIIIEVALMNFSVWGKKVSLFVISLSLVLIVFCWWGIRRQFFVSDEQFLRSMIPHHSGAILMCQSASLKDQEILKLCKNITSSQQTEIEQMKTILDRLENKKTKAGAYD